MLASVASSSLIPQAENSRKTREATIGDDSNKISENLRQMNRTLRVNVCFLRGLADLN